jgi:AcrR family transcriptional regulator
VAVKSKRRVAEATSAHIVESAQRLFLRDGYARTTIEKIAAAAGVVVQTIYNTVGNKAALLLAVFERMIRGPEAPKSVPEFMRERTARARDLAGVIGVMSDWLVEANVRLSALWQVIDEAAAHDPEAKKLATRLSHRRLQNYLMAADSLAERGGRPRLLDRHGVAALIWSLGHPQAYRTLVLEGGWSRERYRAWVASVLSGAMK